MRRHGVKFTQQDFLDSAYEVWGDEYDYSKVKYEHALKKITIICKEHGEFTKTPAKHVNTKQGCPKCSKRNLYKNKSSKILNKKFKYIPQPLKFKIIPLTRGKEVLVSNEDFEMLCKVNWKFNNGYAYNTRLGAMARFIMGYPEGMFVDHINRNPLDNRRENLRVVTPKESVYNTVGYSSSGYKGVSVRENLIYSAMIYEGKRVLYKQVDSVEEGAELYDLYALKYQKEFAYLNFPEKIEEYKKKLLEL